MPPPPDRLLVSRSTAAPRAGARRRVGAMGAPQGVCSQKFGAPLYAGAFLNEELLVLGGGGGKKSSGIPNRRVL